MFLSGGLDSSAIAALMARDPGRCRRFRSPTKRRVQRACRRRARWRRAIGAEPEIVDRRPTTFHALPRLVWHEDEPSRPSSVPLYFVSKLAARRQSGADRRGQRRVSPVRKVSAPLLNWRAGGVYARHAARGPAPVADARVPRAARRRALRPPLVPRHATRTPEARSSTTSPRPLARQRELLSPRLARSTTTRAAPGASRRGSNAPRHGSLLDRVLYADIKTYLVELLMKQDQMSMAASIESRVPFLDHQLVEFAARGPTRPEALRLHDQALLREAVRDLPPVSILDPPEDGVPRAVRPLDAGRLARRGARRTPRSARPRARPVRPPAVSGSSTSTQPAARRRRYPLEPAQPRALVPHLDRRRGRADALRARIERPRRRSRVAGRQPCRALNP